MSMEHNISFIADSMNSPLIIVGSLVDPHYNAQLIIRQFWHLIAHSNLE